ncbi:transposase [Bradyrhizobium japonicum]
MALLDREIAQDAIDDLAVNRLMTITGVNLAVAAGIVAAIGDISRFDSPQKLVSYFGLNPRVRQSGLGAAHHGRISKIGRSHARAMLVEAAWAATKAPGPLHAFFVRIRARRGAHGALLAFVDEGRGLPAGAPGAGRQQDPRNATSSWTSATEGQPAWTSLCLQHQGAAQP